MSSEKTKLDEAKEVLAWMRAEGILSARVGDIILTIDPQEAIAEQVMQAEPRRPSRPRYANPEDDPALYDGINVPSFEPVPKNGSD